MLACEIVIFFLNFRNQDILSRLDFHTVCCYTSHLGLGFNRDKIGPPGMGAQVLVKIFLKHVARLMINLVLGFLCDDGKHVDTYSHGYMQLLYTCTLTIQAPVSAVIKWTPGLKLV